MGAIILDARIDEDNGPYRQEIKVQKSILEMAKRRLFFRLLSKCDFGN